MLIEINEKRNKRKHGTISVGAIVLKPVATEAAPDPGDQLLWELLAARSDLVLLTGDKLLLRDVRMRGRIVSPQAFIGGSGQEFA